MFDDRVTYHITSGLVKMLQGLSGDEEKEVWANIAEATQVCVNKIKTKNMYKSWRWFQYKDTVAKMKVIVDRHGSEENRYYSAEVTLSNKDYQTFTSEQVAEYLIEEVLMGE